MGAPTAWTLYDQFKLKLGQKTIQLATDTMKMGLFTSTSNANTTSMGTATYANLTNEVANANGYSTAGVAFTPSWANSAGTETFTGTSATWTASGAGITARYAVIYDSSTGDLICWCTLDSAPADVATASGNQLTITPNVAGVFTAA
jgi:hypothetical protein